MMEGICDGNLSKQTARIEGKTILSNENLTSQIIKEHVIRLLRETFTVGDQYKKYFLFVLDTILFKQKEHP